MNINNSLLNFNFIIIKGQALNNNRFFFKIKLKNKGIENNDIISNNSLNEEFIIELKFEGDIKEESIEINQAKEAFLLK